MSAYIYFSQRSVIHYLSDLNNTIKLHTIRMELTHAVYYALSFSFRGEQIRTRILIAKLALT